MTKEFVLQDPGEGLHEAEISEINVSEGDTIEEDDVLMTVETDKVSVEIPAPFSGTIEDLRVEVGDEVRVGDVLLTYDESGDSDDEGEDEEEKGEKAEKAEKNNGKKREEKKGQKDQEAESDEDQDDERDEEDEKAKKKESGKKSDEKAEKKRAKKRKKDEKKSEKKSDRERESDGERDGDEEHRDRPVPASPATRRLARELEVDLREVDGSGPEGRVTSDDVRAAAEQGEERGEERKKKRRREPEGRERADFELPRLRRPPLPDFEDFGPVERMPLRGVRRVTAERMALAASQVAAVTHMDVADVTELERMRRRHRDEIEEVGGSLTPTVFVLKAVSAALQQFPRFNASIDVEDEEIVLKKYVNIGVAVDTGRGLLVPVIRDVDRKSIRQLALELVELADRTREGEATRDDLSGGTFTITNPGALGGTGFTPIVNFPEVAILGMARARLESVIEGDLDDHRAETRLRLPLTLTFDHRVVDGAEAARFVRFVVERLENPELLALDA